MAKHPDDRWQSAGDLKCELAWIREEQGASTSDRPVPSFRIPVVGRIAIIGAVIVLAAVVMVVVRSLRETTDAQLASRFTIGLPGFGFLLDASRGAGVPGRPTLAARASSSDGTRVA